MGRISTLYGYISEFPDRDHQYTNHNQKVLKNLPIESDYPFLNRTMFHLAKGDKHTAEISYWGRLIHFGGSFKAIEDDWEAWLQKFENLLTQLIWAEARVHLITEWYPEQLCEWAATNDYTRRLFESPKLLPMTEKDWDFKGLRSFESL